MWLALLIFLFSGLCTANEAEIQTCTFDFDKNGVSDAAVYFKVKEEYRLVALLNTGEKTEAVKLFSSKEKMTLSCRQGNSVKETQAGKGEKKSVEHKTNGTYIELTLPECSSVAFYYKDGKFHEVWTSD